MLKNNLAFSKAQKIALSIQRQMDEMGLNDETMKSLQAQTSPELVMNALKSRRGRKPNVVGPGEQPA